MKIACCFGDDAKAAAPWIEALRAALPDACVTDWDPEAEHAVVWKPTAGFASAHRQLQAVFVAGAGIDAVLALDWPAQARIVRLEDAGMGEQMADYVSAVVLRQFRDFDAYAEQQRDGRWSPQPPADKRDWPVGILGCGVLGQVVAERMLALGFPVLGWSRSLRSRTPVTIHTGPEGLAPFLASTRVLVALLPLTASTQGLVDRRVLDALKRPAYFINIARGRLVVEEDLLSALDDGTLSGATLDVCSIEPAPPDHPFRTHPRVLMTPHVAAATLRAEAVAQIVEKLLLMRNGAAVSGTVSRHLGY